MLPLSSSKEWPQKEGEAREGENSHPNWSLNVQCNKAGSAIIGAYERGAGQHFWMIYERDTLAGVTLIVPPQHWLGWQKKEPLSLLLFFSLAIIFIDIILQLALSLTNALRIRCDLCLCLMSLSHLIQVQRIQIVLRVVAARLWPNQSKSA